MNCGRSVIFSSTLLLGNSWILPLDRRGRERLLVATLGRGFALELWSAAAADAEQQMYVLQGYFMLDFDFWIALGVRFAVRSLSQDGARSVFCWSRRVLVAVRGTRFFASKIRPWLLGCWGILFWRTRELLARPCCLRVNSIRFAKGEVRHAMRLRSLSRRGECERE